ncbi:MAG: LuxR C-terminal-related transcriptional regulator [Thermocrispum sp.]
MTTTDLAPDEAATYHLRRTMRELAQLDGMSMAIGGLVSPGGDRMVLSELHNLRSDLLRGAVIRPGIGLGGLVMQRKRPAAVSDYVKSNEITHQFDRAVEADQIRAAGALPVFVKGALRAVIYGATRGATGFGERTISTATVLARKLAHDIEVEEEVRHRLRRIQAELHSVTGAPDGPRALLSCHDLTVVNAELVAIASAVTDPGLRDRVLLVSSRLTGGSPPGGPTAAAPMLSRREADVLSQLAAGYTNAEIAERLSILPTTVKTHLKHTMRKLGARNRVETVAAARHAGLLP